MKLHRDGFLVKYTTTEALCVRELWLWEECNCLSKELYRCLEVNYDPVLVLTARSQ